MTHAIPNLFGMMIRQVTLAVNSENRLQESAAANQVELEVVDCKTFNGTGMSLLLDLRGEPEAIRKTVAEIRSLEGVREALQGEGPGDRVPLLVVMKRLPFCGAASDAAIICLECPLNSRKSPAKWRFIVSKSSDLRLIMSRMAKENVVKRIVDVSPLTKKPGLTSRQKEIMATAVARGYFEFPRKISLTSLSQIVGVKPSTLSEILRSAERRIMEESVGVPFLEEHWRFPD
jgi:hypothetical protein